MTTETDVKRYKELWNEQVSELSGLAWNLNPEQYKRLKVIQGELRLMVEAAGNDIELARKQEASIAIATKAAIAFSKSKEELIG